MTSYYQKAVICSLVALTCYVIRPRALSSESVGSDPFANQHDFTRYIDFSGQESHRVRYLQDNDFWQAEQQSESADQDGETPTKQDSSGGMAHAGHIATKEEAKELEASGEHVFYSFEDVPKIEKFLKAMVTQTAVIYEGTWTVSDDYQAHRQNNILDYAFGREHEDEHGARSTKTGKLRTFFTKTTLTQRSPEEDYFGSFFSQGSGPDLEEQKPSPPAMNDTASPANSTELEKILQPMEVKTAIRAKAILFDGDYREKEIDLYFAINPKSRIGDRLRFEQFTADGKPLNLTEYKDGKEIPENLIDKLTLENLLIGFQFKHNFFIVDEKSTRVNLTITDCSGDVALKGQCLDLTLVGLPVNYTDPTTGEQKLKESIFPGKIHFRLQLGILSDYLSNISNYAFMTTMVIIVSFFTMLGVIKKVTENHALAQSISPVSIGLNLIWNFFFFAINFQFSIQGEAEFMQYLGLPAFWYFISSFTFESRLFILVWRAQLDQRLMFDEQFLRRRLTWFYILFYVLCFLAVVFQSTLLYSSWAILLFNSTLWIPQIIHSYIARNRRGPSLRFLVALFSTQSFMPLYLKIDSSNFLDQPSQPFMAMLIISFMVLQLYIIKRQQLVSARWFVPKRFRRNPFAYDYYRKVTQDVYDRARERDDPTAVSTHEGDVTCVICMNYIHHAVDQHGGAIVRQMRNGEVIRSGDEPAQDGEVEHPLEFIRQFWLEIKTRMRRTRARQDTNSNNAGTAAVASEQEMASVREPSGGHQAIELTDFNTTEEGGGVAPLHSQLLMQTAPDESQEISTIQPVQQTESAAAPGKVSQSDLESQKQATEQASASESSTSQAESDSSDSESDDEIRSIMVFNKEYMKTPCNHSYHTVCLKKWMEIRLECPTCRQVIPLPDEE